MSKLYEEIEIKTDYITLGQFLKLANILDSGGMIKIYIQETGVLVNGERDYRRGRKLYDEDLVEVDQVGKFVVKKLP